MAKLTARQARFVEEYLIDLNATQAAVRAGFSVKSAGEIGSRLLKNVNVSQALGVAMAERSKRTGINQDRVVRELARIAYAKAGDIIDDEDGRLRPGLSDDDAACVQSIRVRSFPDGTEREVRLYDKQRALELLYRHTGGAPERVDVTSGGSSVQTGVLLATGFVSPAEWEGKFASGRVKENE